MNSRTTITGVRVAGGEEPLGSRHDRGDDGQDGDHDRQDLPDTLEALQAEWSLPALRLRHPSLSPRRLSRAEQSVRARTIQWRDAVCVGRREASITRMARVRIGAMRGGEKA